MMASNPSERPTRTACRRSFLAGTGGPLTSGGPAGCLGQGEDSTTRSDGGRAGDAVYHSDHADTRSNHEERQQSIASADS